MIGGRANQTIPLHGGVFILSETTQYIILYQSFIYTFLCNIYHLVPGFFFSVIDVNLCTITNHSNEETKTIHTPV